jgi:hypothetical protein
MANELNFIQVKPPEFQQSPLVTAFNAFMQMKDKKYQRAKEARAEGREDKKLSLEEQKIASEEKLNVARAENLKLEKEKFQEENKKDARRQKASERYGQLLSSLPDEIQHDPAKLAEASTAFAAQAAAETGADQKWQTDQVGLVVKTIEVRNSAAPDVTIGIDQYGNRTATRVDKSTGRVLGSDVISKGPGKEISTPGSGTAMLQPDGSLKTLVAGQFAPTGGGGSGPSDKLTPQQKSDEKMISGQIDDAARELSAVRAERARVEQGRAMMEGRLKVAKANAIYQPSPDNQTALAQAAQEETDLRAQHSTFTQRENEIKSRHNRLVGALRKVSAGLPVDLSEITIPLSQDAQPQQGPPVAPPGGTGAPGFASAALGGGRPAPAPGRGVMGSLDDFGMYMLGLGKKSPAPAAIGGSAGGFRGTGQTGMNLDVAQRSL